MEAIFWRGHGIGWYRSKATLTGFPFGSKASKILILLRPSSTHVGASCGSCRKRRTRRRLGAIEAASDATQVPTNDSCELLFVLRRLCAAYPEWQRVQAR